MANPFSKKNKEISELKAHIASMEKDLTNKNAKIEEMKAALAAIVDAYNGHVMPKVHAIGEALKPFGAHDHQGGH